MTAAIEEKYCDECYELYPECTCGCFTCGGEGWMFGDDFEDPMWYDKEEIYRCPNCNGSGLARDQTYW